MGGSMGAQWVDICKGVNHFDGPLHKDWGIMGSSYPIAHASHESDSSTKCERWPLQKSFPTPSHLPMSFSHAP